jgi:hypothetical protein
MAFVLCSIAARELTMDSRESGIGGAALCSTMHSQRTALHCVAVVGPERVRAPASSRDRRGKRVCQRGQSLNERLSNLCLCLSERALRNNCLWLDGMIQQNGSCVCSDGKDKNSNGPQFVDRRGGSRLWSRGTWG